MGYILNIDNGESERANSPVRSLRAAYDGHYSARYGIIYEV